jgi:hypothetical protein
MVEIRATESEMWLSAEITKRETKFEQKNPSSRDRTSDIKITDEISITVLRSSNWAIEGYLYYFVIYSCCKKFGGTPGKSSTYKSWTQY